MSPNLGVQQCIWAELLHETGGLSATLAENPLGRLSCNPAQNSFRLVPVSATCPDQRTRDKRLLMDEVVTLKTEKDRLERELNRKDAQLLEAKSSVDKSSVAMTNAETKIQTLKAQVSHEWHSVSICISCWG